MAQAFPSKPINMIVAFPAGGPSDLGGSPLELILTPLGLSAAKNKAEDVRMIAVTGRNDLMLAVRKDFPAATTEQFLAALKAISVAAHVASPRFPKLPLLTAVRGYEDFTFGIWSGIQTGAKVPDSVVNVLHKSAYDALANPEVKKQLEASGSYLLAPMSVAQLNAFYAKETAMYRAIAKSINLEAQ